MDQIRSYVLSVTAAAILCAVLRSQLPGKGSAAAVLKLVGGLFLAFTVIQPVARIDLSQLSALTEEPSWEAGDVVAEGEKIAEDALRAIIKEQTEAYILDKARQLDAPLQILVTLSDDTMPVPIGIRLTGTATPYAKIQLQRLIEEDIGIPKENQIWIAKN